MDENTVADTLEADENIGDDWGFDGDIEDTAEAQGETGEQADPPDGESDAQQPESAAPTPAQEQETELMREMAELRAQRDQALKERQGLEASHKLVESYAERFGVSADEYIRQCRIRDLVDGGLDETQAKYQIETENQLSELQS